MKQGSAALIYRRIMALVQTCWQRAATCGRNLQAVEKLALQSELALVKLAAKFMRFQRCNQLLSLLHLKCEPCQLVRMRSPGAFSLLLSRVGFEFSLGDQLDSFVTMIIETHMQFLIEVDFLVL